MYDVDERDVVVLAEGIPACDPGAPIPVVVADDVGATVAYYAPNGVDREAARPEHLGDNDAVVVLRFEVVHSLMFGAPNDEGLHGHPLADRGLQRYGAHRVESSSWIVA